jgi:hypothetical protein
MTVRNLLKESSGLSMDRPFRSAWSRDHDGCPDPVGSVASCAIEHGLDGMESLSNVEVVLEALRRIEKGALKCLDPG